MRQLKVIWAFAESKAGKISCDFLMCHIPN